MRAVVAALLTLVVAVFAGYGDPIANPAVPSDSALLPTAPERAFHAAWNFLRSDPGWWRLNIPVFIANRQNGNDFLGGVEGVGVLPYDRRLAGAAHYHAGRMVFYSPDTCDPAPAYVYNATDCLPNKNEGLGTVCCFRQEDCDNCTRGPDYRIIDFGFRWNKTITAGGGYGEGIASNTAPTEVATAVAGIACAPEDPATAPETCASKDNSNLNRQAIFGPRDSKGKLYRFTAGGAGYASGGKESNYWVFDSAFGPAGDASFNTEKFQIASASYVGWNSSFGGWLLNWDESAGSGANPDDVIVVTSGGAAKHLTKLGTGQNYFVADVAPSSCTAFAFGAKKGSNNYRYPQNGNVQWGCSSDYAADAQSCGTCGNGICFQSQCYQFSTTTPPSSASSLLVSGVVILLAALLALLF